MKREQALEVVLSGIREHVAATPELTGTAIHAETVLYGREGLLTSLGLVSVLVAIEQEVADRFDLDITIADERAMSQERSPFRSVQSLADYVAGLVG